MVEPVSDIAAVVPAPPPGRNGWSSAAARKWVISVPSSCQSWNPASSTVPSGIPRLPTKVNMNFHMPTIA